MCALLRRPVSVVLALVLVIGAAVTAAGSPEIAGASSPPPFCVGRQVSDGSNDLCDPNYDDGSSDDLDLLVLGGTNGGSMSVQTSIPQCAERSGDEYSPSPCFSGVEFSFGSQLQCAYVDSYDRGTSRPPSFPSLSRPCNFSPSDQLGLLFGNYIYKEIGFSTEPGYDLGLFKFYTESGRGDGEICRSYFTPATTWVPELTCEYPLSTPLPVEGLLGDTWVRASATLIVEEVTLAGPTDRREKAFGWVPVNGSERVRRPIAAIDSEPADSGPGAECNRIRFTNDSISQYDGPMTYEWEFTIARPGATEMELWATSSAREPVMHFPPVAVALGTLTVSANGLSDTAVDFAFVRPDCGGPDDPPIDGASSVVVIEATDDAAAESGSNTGTWTLTRTDDELDEITVAVSVSGSATEGVDYTPLPDTVRFPAGVTAVPVQLAPIDDSRVESNEAVTMTIEPGLGYTVGDPDRGTISIFDDDVSAGSSLFPVIPARLLETRAVGSTVDGEFEAAGRLEAGSVTPVQVAGRGGVDADADAVAVNVTAIGAGGPGFVTLFPCGGEQPTTSSLNYRGGGVAGNAGIVKLSADGTVCVFTQADTDLVVDVNAWLDETASFESLTPVRLAETRDGEETVDGDEQALGRLEAGSVTELQIAGRGGVAVDADAVALNATAIRPDGPGFITLYPCDQERPTTSSLNYAAGGAVGNSAVVSLSADGTLCVFTSNAADLVIDVNAWFADDASFDPFVPARFFETRAGESTVDGLFEAVGRLAAASVTPIEIAGRGDVPAGSSAVALNVTAVRPDGVGFVTLFPCDGEQPLTSSLNYAAGGAVGNSGVVKLAADGSVCVFTTAATDLVIDVNAAWS